MADQNELNQLLENAPSFPSIAKQYIDIAERLVEHTRLEAQELARIIQETHLANKS